MHRLWISGLDTLLRTNFAMLMVKIPKSGILTLTDAQWMPLKVAIWFKIPQSNTHDKVFRNSCSVLFTFFVNWRKFKLIITSNSNEPNKNHARGEFSIRHFEACSVPGFLLLFYLYMTKFWEAMNESLRNQHWIPL